MKEEKDKYPFYCNYCGEPVYPILPMIRHMEVEHAAEVHAGPGEYDPRRKRISKVMGAVGSATIVIAALLLVLVVGLDLNLIVLPCIAAASLLYVGCGLYETKGRKAGDEILMDLLVDCDICGKRIQFRDLSLHLEATHPEQHAAVKKVDDPIEWAIIGLMGMGGVGFVIAYSALSVSEDTHIAFVILFVASLAAVGIGTALTVLFGELVYRPRTRRLAKEWVDRHPGTKRE
ncbi:MAG: hypothetical protein MUE55_06015 [Thermoplasmata archaeon]|jgi:hypothetical protein|nr:hypothetical protein [Thermoplasmata archaeon]